MRFPEPKELQNVMMGKSLEWVQFPEPKKLGDDIIGKPPEPKELSKVMMSKPSELPEPKDFVGQATGGGAVPRAQGIV